MIAPALTLITLLVLSTLPLHAGSVVIPGARSELFERLGPLGPSAEIAVAPDGRRAAAAIPLEGRDLQTRITIVEDATDPMTAAVKGNVRALVFSPDSRVLYALQHRPAKKHEGNATLLAIPLGGTKPRAEAMKLPPSAMDLAYWPAGGALLVATRNEIRTVRLPAMRSGPLYRIPGENLSVAAVDGGARILVGQDQELLLVDLSDPPGRYEMPVRDRRPSGASVVSLGVAPASGDALAHLADGRLLRISLNPLTLEAAGEALVLARPGRAAAPRYTIAPRPRPETPPRPVPRPPLPSPRVDPPASSTDSPRAPPVEPPASPPPPEPVLAPTREPVRPAAEGPAIRGRVVDLPRDVSVTVVLFGPNSMVREALRVRPEPDGAWLAEGLKPGRYRIQLDAGGSRVLVTRPPAVVVDLGDGMLDAPDFRVVGSH